MFEPEDFNRPIVLMAASAFAAPRRIRGPLQKTFTVTFTYNRAAPAKTIYQRLERTSRNAPAARRVG